MHIIRLEIRVGGGDNDLEDVREALVIGIEAFLNIAWKDTVLTSKVVEEEEE